MTNIYTFFLLFSMLALGLCSEQEAYANEGEKNKQINTTSNDGQKDSTTNGETTKDVRIVDGKLWIDGKEIKDPALIAKYMGKQKALQEAGVSKASGDLENLIGTNLLDFKVEGDCEKESVAAMNNCDIKMIDGVLYKDGDVVPEAQWDEVLRINTTMEDLLDLNAASFEEKDGGILSEQEVGRIIENEWRVRSVKNDFNRQSGLSLDDAVWNMMDGELSETQLNYIARKYEVSPTEVANHVRALEAANGIKNTQPNVGATRIADANEWIDNTLETVQGLEQPKPQPELSGGSIASTVSYHSADAVPLTSSNVAEGRKILLSNLYNEDIPAFNHYHGAWDTRKIHNYKYDLSRMKDTVEFFLSHGIGDDFRMPTMGYVTSNFGPRRWRYHNGIDLKLQKGDPVYSMFEGKVRIAQYSRSYGYVVVVRHYNGLETLYAHLSKLKVKSGDRVESGSIVGLGGSTGRSTGNHLHFEVRYKGHPINPNELIDFNTKILKHHTFTVDRSYFTSTNPYQSAHGGTGGKKYYKIRRGDTLGKIARRNGTSVKQLCRLNSISSRTTLRVGRSIRVN